eukprot:scaffold72783_cov69-Phaeocystis_antarctica.AAC.3
MELKRSEKGPAFSKSDTIYLYLSIYLSILSSPVPRRTLYEILHHQVEVLKVLEQVEGPQASEHLPLGCASLGWPEARMLRDEATRREAVRAEQEGLHVFLRALYERRWERTRLVPHVLDQRIVELHRKAVPVLARVCSIGQREWSRVFMRRGSRVTGLGFGQHSP